MQLAKRKLFYKSIILGFVVFIADIISKNLVFGYLNELPTKSAKITNFFNLVMVENRGVSFGLFRNIPNAPIILTIVGVLVMLFVIFWLTKEKNKAISYPLGLILGGAAGNIFDRIINGTVSDFLDFHYNGMHWPSFNVADIALTLGVTALIIDEIWAQRNKNKGDSSDDKSN